MGQAEILKLLEKENGKISAKEIMKKLNLSANSVNTSLKVFREKGEISFVIRKSKLHNERLYFAKC